MATRDKEVQENRVSLEDKTRECSVLTRRLEQVLEDARQQVTQILDPSEV